MYIFNGFEFLFAHPTALLFVFIGAFTGTVVGAIPGMTAAAAIAMIMPSAASWRRSIMPRCLWRAMRMER